MNRTAIRRERNSVALGVVLMVVIIVRAVMSGDTPLLMIFRITDWSAFIVLAIAHYRLLGREGYYESARYPLAWSIGAVLCWLPFAVDTVRDCIRDQSFWGVVLLAWFTFVLWNGWRWFQARSVGR